MAESEQAGIQRSIDKAVETWLASPEIEGMDPEEVNRQAADLRKHLIHGGTTMGWGAGLVVGTGAKLVATFLSLIGEFRRSNPEAFSEISKEALSEFLGADFSNIDIKLEQSKDASIDASRQIGKILHDRLESEFAPDGVVTEDSGTSAARTFSGYAVNFSVQNAVISTLTDCLSAHYLQEFKELGVEVAQNLGLGRLQRHALGPLIKTTIADPYTRALNAKYRQNRLPVAEALRAFYRGGKDEQTLRDELARHGYRDEDINQLITEHNPKISAADLETLVRFGKMDRDEALRQLISEGVQPSFAEQKMQLAECARAQAAESSWLTQLEHQAKHGFISQADFADALDKLHLTDAEKATELRLVGDYIESRFKRPTWGEAVKAYHHGACDLGYLEQWLVNEGFDGEDQQIMLSLAQQEYKRPPWAQVAKAYEAGQVTLDYVEQWLTAHGYNLEDAQVLEYNLLNDQAAKIAKAQAAARKAVGTTTTTAKTSV